MNSSTAPQNEVLTITEAPADSTIQQLNDLAARSASQPIVLAEPPPRSETATVQPFNALTTTLQSSRRNVRNGKIARLPKLHRDMVNRMLQNNIPHSKIVKALDEFDIFVTERNISNWRTRGGYQEWCLEQERALQLSHMQDHLTDHLRKNDAQQIPEVGLQVAATQLSSLLLNPDAVRQLTAEPEKYSKVVDMLCRLSTHIQTLQKDRNEAVKLASNRTTAEYMKREKENEIDMVRQTYSAEYSGKTAYDPDIPHRNELPPRDEPPYKDPAPRIDMLDIMQTLAKSKQKEAGQPNNTAPANATP